MRVGSRPRGAVARRSGRSRTARGTRSGAKVVFAWPLSGLSRVLTAGYGRIERAGKGSSPALGLLQLRAATVQGGDEVYVWLHRSAVDHDRLGAVLLTGVARSMALPHRQPPGILKAADSGVAISECIAHFGGPPNQKTGTYTIEHRNGGRIVQDRAGLTDAPSEFGGPRRRWQPWAVPHRLAGKGVKREPRQVPQRSPAEREPPCRNSSHLAHGYAESRCDGAQAVTFKSCSPQRDDFRTGSWRRRARRGEEDAGHGTCCTMGGVQLKWNQIAT